MPTGRGKTLGAAVVDLYRQVSGDRPRRSYTATGWHAQLRALTETRAGLAAAAKVDLSPSRRTLLAWLAERQAPSVANRVKITQAYQMLRVGFNRSAVARDIKITGQVTFVNPNGRRDRRFRGRGGTAPLLVNGRDGDWGRSIEPAWNSGERDTRIHETLFILDVIVPDIGEVSEGSWGSAFDGSWYEVEV